MNILVTGGAGYIGSHTCVELLQNGYNVIVVDNLCNSNEKSLEVVKRLTGKDLKFYKCDICDQEGLDKIFSENQVDAVIHFAGLKAVGESSVIPLNYYYNNITGTLILLEVMKKHNVKKIVFSSSATVYGTPKKVPLDEGQPSDLNTVTNPYGKTKLMIEEILQDLYKSDNEWGIVLLRYFNPIGAHESSDLGESPNGIPNNLMPYVTQVAVGKREKLTVFGGDYATPDGTCVRDYIHVVDLAKGHIKAIEYIKDKKIIDVFNLGTGKGYSVLDIIKTFDKVNDLKLPYVMGARRAGDVPALYSDPTKAAEVLGWKAERDLNTMCKDSWNWQKKHPNGFDD